MALATTLYEWLGSADAHLETLCAPENAQPALSLLDAFFQQATGLQLQREQLKALSREAQTALNEDTRLVFLLYMRVLALLKKQVQQQKRQQRQTQPQDEVLLLDTKLVDSVLHVTRVVPFCQLYARNNAKSVGQLLTELVVHVEGFEASVRKLHDVYLKHLQKLHVSVQQDKRNQVLDLTQSVYEANLSLDGLLTSDSMVTPLLLSGGKDLEFVFQGETLMRALVVCYESDLPTLQRHLVKLDDKAQGKILIIAETRRLLLQLTLSFCFDVQVLGRFMNLLMKKQDDGNHDEVLLEVLHMISHCCEEANSDQGSYLSDLWHLCGYKDKISTFLESGEIESDHVSYLEMIVDGLPRRRIISAGMSSAKTPSAAAQETGRAADSVADSRGGHAGASAGGFGQHDDEEEKDEPHAVIPGSEDAAMLSSMVHQVKDFFPDLGDGYIELCLISSQKQLETVINFLLESNPPPALLEVRQDLKRSDPEFAIVEAKLIGKTPAAAAKPTAMKPTSEEKLDPSRVWVGKKPQEKHYDPQILKRNTALAEKTKKIANMIVEEEEIMAGMTPFLKLDEYDDDYNDEFEDYEPFSVHDSGQTDQDTVRQQNRLMLAREAEDAFWESMKNMNHQQPVAHGEEIDEDKESKETYEFNPNKMRAPVVRGGSSAIAVGQQKQQGPPQAKPSTDQKKKNGQQNWKKTAPAPGPAPDAAGVAAGATPEKTKEQELRARARSAKNKAKVGNHNRKDRALKKQG